MSRARSTGFTLIEVLVAIFLVGTATVLFGAALNTLAFTRSVRYDDTALRIAQQKLETLRAGGYSSLPASGSFSDPLLANLPDGYASTTVSDFNAKTKEVIVEVGWQQAGKATRSISLSTLITQSGL